jgi:hypothetical protein
VDSLFKSSEETRYYYINAKGEVLQIESPYREEVKFTHGKSTYSNDYGGINHVELETEKLEVSKPIKMGENEYIQMSPSLNSGLSGFIEGILSQNDFYRQSNCELRKELLYRNSYIDKPKKRKKPIFRKFFREVKK